MKPLPPRIRKTMVFVLLALFLGQFGSGVYDLIFSNFLRDAQHLDVEMRGLIEFPRELPGILSLFVVSLLFMFNEVRMAGVACLLMFGGMYALAFCGAGTSLWTLSAWILTVSLGQHILMGMIDTIVIHTARPENRSLRLRCWARCACGSSGNSINLLPWTFSSRGACACWHPCS